MQKPDTIQLLMATKELLFRSVWIKGTPRGCGSIQPEHCWLSAFSWTASTLGFSPYMANTIAVETIAVEVLQTTSELTIPALHLIPWYNDRGDTTFFDIITLHDRAIEAAQIRQRASGIRLVS